MRCKRCKRSFRTLGPNKDDHNWQKQECHNCHYMGMGKGSSHKSGKHYRERVRGNNSLNSKFICSSTLRKSYRISSELLDTLSYV